MSPVHTALTSDSLEILSVSISELATLPLINILSPVAGPSLIRSTLTPSLPPVCSNLVIVIGAALLIILYSFLLPGNDNQRLDVYCGLLGVASAIVCDLSDSR